MTMPESLCHRRRPVLAMAAVTGAAVAIALGTSGCGTSGGAPKTSATKTAAVAAQPVTSPSTAASSPSPSSGAQLLTGTALNSLLLPASALPAGFTLDTQGSRNTESGFMPDSPAPVAASQLCQRLTGTAWISTGGIDSSSFAQNDYVNSGHTEEAGQEIDGFQQDDAHTVMTKLWHVFSQCRTFSYTDSSMTITTRISRATMPGVGDEAIKAVLTAPQFTGGQTLAAVRVGDYIVTTFYSSSGSDDGAAAVTWATTLAAKVKHAAG